MARSFIRSTLSFATCKSSNSVNYPVFCFFKAKATLICLLFHPPPIVFDSLGRRQLACHQPGWEEMQGDARKIRDSEKYAAFKCKSGGESSGDLFRLEVLQVSSGGGRAPFLLSKNKVSHALVGEREHSASLAGEQQHWFASMKKKFNNPMECVTPN